MTQSRCFLRWSFLVAMLHLGLTGCDETESSYPEMGIRSAAFGQDEALPSNFACNNVSPPLSFSNAPEGTKSLAVIMDNPEGPAGVYTHWVMWNLSPKSVVPEDIRKPENRPEGAVLGLSDNTTSENGEVYEKPCSQEGATTFVFQVYALDKKLTLKETSRRKALDKAMDGHILARGELRGVVFPQ